MDSLLRHSPESPKDLQKPAANDNTPKVDQGAKNEAETPFDAIKDEDIAGWIKKPETIEDAPIDAIADENIAGWIKKPEAVVIPNETATLAPEAVATPDTAKAPAIELTEEDRAQHVALTKREIPETATPPHGIIDRLFGAHVERMGAKMGNATKEWFAKRQNDVTVLETKLGSLDKNIELARTTGHFAPVEEKANKERAGLVNKIDAAKTELEAASVQQEEPKPVSEQDLENLGTDLGNYVTTWDRLFGKEVPMKLDDLYLAKFRPQDRSQGKIPFKEMEEAFKKALENKILEHNKLLVKEGREPIVYTPADMEKRMKAVKEEYIKNMRVEDAKMRAL